MFKVHDRVSHKHYPNTHGNVVALYGPVVVVLWDEVIFDNAANLPQRTSRHIPGALNLVSWPACNPSEAVV
jgi:hypothetical protein